MYRSTIENAISSACSHALHPTYVTNINVNTHSTGLSGTSVIMRSEGKICMSLDDSVVTV